MIENYKKFQYIEGIRGIMAINVLLCHFVCVYYPEAYFLDYVKKSSNSVNYFATTALSCLVNGNVAVLFFFIISGYFTATSVFNNKIEVLKIGRNIISRYFRLMPIVFFATIFSFVLMYFGLMYNLKFADIVRNPKFLLEYCNFSPTLQSAIYNGLVKSFIVGNDYNGPFWTIKFEFLGFIFVSIITSICKGKKWRRFIYIVCVILICLIHVYYSFFILGVIIADLRHYTKPDTSILSRYYTKLLRNKFFLLLLMIIGVSFLVFL